jgi:hypothetical protein
MATVNDIIINLRDDLWITVAQVPDVAMLRYFNRALHRTENEIVRFLKDNYFRETAKALNTVNGTAIYNLPGWNSTGPDSWSFPMFKKLLQLTVQYWTDLAPCKAVQKDYSALDRPLSRYATNQPFQLPFYILMWSEQPIQVQIFPTPTVAVTGWITIDYEASQADMLITDNVNVIPLDRQYHYVIEEWMRYRVNKRRKWVWSAEATASLNEFKMVTNDMLSELSDRLIRPQYQQLEIPTFMMR